MIEIHYSSTLRRDQKRIIDWFAAADDVIVETFDRTSGASKYEIIDAIATRSRHGTPTSNLVTVCGAVF